MFEHSVKVPRHYKIASNIFKKVSTEGGSVKTLLYDGKLRHFRTNVIYALITETIKHAADINKIFESCGILSNEPRLDPWLAKVLTAELLFGKKALPGKSKPEQTILSYQDQFIKYTTEHQDTLKTEVVRRPRYVRINTNLLTTSDAIREFQDEGYHFVRCTSTSYNDYLNQIRNLGEYDFTQDYHVKTIFVFSSGTKLHQHELYLDYKIILQDRATAMAVHLLAPPAGSVALDMCAAPGMKTTQLAAYLRNEGKIYAVERNEERYMTLCDFVERTGSKCVKTMHKDALEIKRGDCSDVEYILLDPSCSGSGMELCVHNYIEDTRLAKLTSLQEKFLKHAMNAFPKAKRIVYSTCSLFPEENERVITNVVKTSRAKWRVQDVKVLLKEQWNNFGSGMYGSMGTRCMYAKPDLDLTTGFFLAVLDRDPKDLERSLLNFKETTSCEGDKSNKKNEHEEVTKMVEQNGETEDNTELDEAEKIVKNKKKKHKITSDMDSVAEKLHNINIETNENNPKKKKKRKKDTEEMVIIEGATDNLELNSLEPVKKKKKKNKDKIDEISVEKNIEEMVIIEDATDNLELNSLEPVKKKKKKNKDKIDEISVEKNITIENESQDATDDLKLEGSFKHVKRKKKMSSNNEGLGLEQNVNDSDKCDIPRKRKKKKHNIVEIDD